MHRKETLEKAWIAGERAQDPAAQTWARFDGQQQVGQRLRNKGGGAGTARVAAEIVSRMGVEQRGALVQGEGEAFAGDGVDIAGGVADERDVPA